jgi:hypothetical protein
VALTVSSSAAASGVPNGVLAFSGGVHGQAKIDRSSCTAGPGNSIAVALTGVGGWQSLYLTVSTPRQGKSGTTKVSLQGTGNKSNSYAIAVWSWVKKASTRTDAQVHVAAKGNAGALDVKLPLVSVADSASLPDVLVAFKWTSATCG